MMGSRTFVTFDADIEDDSILDELGHIQAPSGRNICERLVGRLRASGHSVSEPEQHSFYGWAFIAKIDGEPTWLMLQNPDPWLLMVQNRSKKGWFRKAPEPSAATLELVHESLDSLDEISDIRWFTPQQYQSNTDPGSPTP